MLGGVIGGGDVGTALLFLTCRNGLCHIEGEIGGVERNEEEGPDP